MAAWPEKSTETVLAPGGGTQLGFDPAQIVQNRNAQELARRVRAVLRSLFCHYNVLESLVDS